MIPPWIPRWSEPPAGHIPRDRSHPRRGQAIAKRLRLVARPGADEDAQLATARQAAPQRVGARRPLPLGPAGEDFLPRQGRGALAQELLERFEGWSERRIRRLVRQQ